MPLMLLGGFVGAICAFTLLYLVVFLIVVNVCYMIWGKRKCHGDYRRLTIFKGIFNDSENSRQPA